ncbi:fasciclin-2-like isoform X1 [Artemia franciscana]|uniref:fasciclin-2-like isoform X1 n=1 Tax=Artemia franciscana TaxID=6661 RepID=UPI0032DB610C
MKNLKPDTFYKVEIRAHNAIGFSEPTGIIVKTAKGSFGSNNWPIWIWALIFIAIAVTVVALIAVRFYCQKKHKGSRCCSSEEDEHIFHT